MPVEIQMKKPLLGNQTSTRFIVAPANARILELILTPIQRSLFIAIQYFT